MPRNKRYLKIALFGFLLSIVGLIFVSWKNDIPLEELKKKYSTPNSKYISIQNTKVHYQEKGTGQPLVLLHGTASSSHTWSKWIDILSEDFRVIAPDLPSFGLTGPREDEKYSIEDMTNFLTEFLKKVGVDTLCIGGNSLGGYYAWDFAEKNPLRVKKLMLSNSLGYPTNMKKPIGFRLAASPIAPLLKKLTPRFLIEATLKKSFANEQLVDDQMIDRYLELLLREGNRNAYIQRMAQRTPIDTTRIAKIQVPSLIMWGVLDQVVPSVHAFKFYRDLPMSTMKLYPEIGHLPMEELPEASAEDFKEFLLTPIEEKKDLQLIPRDLS